MFLADPNVLWRVVDVRKALIMVDDLVHGMEQMLTLGVQEVVREAPLENLRAGDDLDADLQETRDFVKELKDFLTGETLTVMFQYLQ